jgi:hypothetical protein
LSFRSVLVTIVTGTAIVTGVAGGIADAASADGAIGIKSSLKPSLGDAGASASADALFHFGNGTRVGSN